MCNRDFLEVITKVKEATCDSSKIDEVYEHVDQQMMGSIEEDLKILASRFQEHHSAIADQFLN